MPRLLDVLWAEPVRDRFVADGARLIESHVAARGGLKGVALRTGFAVLKSLKPDAVPRALRALTPEFAAALDPLYQEYLRAGARGSGGDFTGFMQQRAERAAAALLQVSDARAQASGNAALRSLYARLRPGAIAEVQAVLPRLADLIGRYTGPQA